MLGRAGGGKQLERWSDGCAELAGLDDGHCDIICKDCRGWCWLPRRQGEAAELTAVLKAGEVRGDEVGDGKPELTAKGAALGEADIADAGGFMVWICPGRGRSTLA